MNIEKLFSELQYANSRDLDVAQALIAALREEIEPRYDTPRREALVEVMESIVQVEGMEQSTKCGVIFSPAISGAFNTHPGNTGFHFYDMDDCDEVTSYVRQARAFLKAT